MAFLAERALLVERERAPLARDARAATVEDRQAREPPGLATLNSPLRTYLVFGAIPFRP